MELGGWRTRSMFARYNVTSERDLADAVERVSRYVVERGAERPKVRPLHPEAGGSDREPAQNPHNPPAEAAEDRVAVGVK